MHNPKEEIPVHPETSSKYLIALQWNVGEVVGVQNAIALRPLPRLALAAAWCRATALRLYISGVQIG